jgi:hypothetical protein
MTPFDPWLRALAAAGQGGDALYLPPATRGLAWSEPIEIEGNWTGATIAGTISLVPDAASPLATFAISALAYDATADVTLWVASLAAGAGANATGSLPGDPDGDGVVELPCSFRLTPAGGQAETLFGAVFTVLGKA